MASAICTSWKAEILTATHDFTATTGNVFKCALFPTAAALDGTVTAYGTGAAAAANETTGTGYTAGGVTLTANITPATSGTTAFTSWTTNAQWTGATFSAQFALIYNSTKANRGVCVIDFGSSQSVTAGTFTIQWPTNDATNAILRIA